MGRVEMMRLIVLLTGLAVLASALAGCADEPPSGEFTASPVDLGIDGTATFEYQAKSRPGDLDNEVGDAICANNPDLEGCAEPFTSVRAHFMSLPDPSSEGYTLVLTSAAGDELDLGGLEQNGTMYELPEQEFDEDHSGDFDTAELRMGDVLVATASTNEGEQAFEPVSDLTGIQATVTWEGRQLSGTVSGAPEDLGLTAWLYQEGEEGVEPVESFPVTGNEEFSYEAEQNLDSYAQFHLHVGGSRINVAQGDVE